MSGPAEPLPAAPRRIAKWKLVLLAILVATAGSAPWWGPQVMRRMAFFRVRRVEIVGARYLPPSDILRRLAVDTLASVWDDFAPLERRMQRQRQQWQPDEGEEPWGCPFLQRCGEESSDDQVADGRARGEGGQQQAGGAGRAVALSHVGHDECFRAHEQGWREPPRQQQTPDMVGSEELEVSAPRLLQMPAACRREDHRGGRDREHRQQAHDLQGARGCEGSRCPQPLHRGPTEGQTEQLRAGADQAHHRPPQHVPVSGQQSREQGGLCGQRDRLPHRDNGDHADRSEGRQTPESDQER